MTFSLRRDQDGQTWFSSEGIPPRMVKNIQFLLPTKGERFYVSEATGLTSFKDGQVVPPDAEIIDPPEGSGVVIMDFEPTGSMITAMRSADFAHLAEARAAELHRFPQMAEVQKRLMEYYKSGMEPPPPPPLRMVDSQMYRHLEHLKAGRDQGKALRAAALMEVLDLVEQCTNNELDRMDNERRENRRHDEKERSVALAPILVARNDEDRRHSAEMTRIADMERAVLAPVEAHAAQRAVVTAEEFYERWVTALEQVIPEDLEAAILFLKGESLQSYVDREMTRYVSRWLER